MVSITSKIMEKAINCSSSSILSILISLMIDSRYKNLDAPLDTRYLESLKSGIINREIRRTVVLDISRSFDQVCHEGILNKLPADG